MPGLTRLYEAAEALLKATDKDVANLDANTLRALLTKLRVARCVQQNPNYPAPATRPPAGTWGTMPQWTPPPQNT